VRCDEEVLSGNIADESGLAPGWADGVIFPSSTLDVQKIVRSARDHQVALVPRGGGTGKAGGCIPNGGFVVSMVNFNRILEISSVDGCAVIEPGVITGSLDAVAGDCGLAFAPDPGSLEACTVGGNIATNAAGPRALKYGVTREHTWAVEVVTPRGDIIRPGRRAIKGVAGFDITALMVGSEGCLGFITGATVRLIDRPAAAAGAWIGFADVEAACAAADEILASGARPALMELLDQRALELVEQHDPSAVPRGDSKKLPGAVILLETDGPNERRATEDLEHALLAIAESPISTSVSDLLVSQSETQRLAARRARELVSPLLMERFPHKISDDVAVPRGRMSDLHTVAQREAAAAGIEVCVFGHLGDGNLHVSVLRQNENDDRASGLRMRIMRHVVDLGGTISAEHGIGLAKRDILTLEQDQALLALQRQIKQLFDPAGIMNPGKVL